MPVRKQDAYRALELLEEYYNRLDAPEDQPLKNAIDRVIRVFKSRLFQALMDIQEFYESILLDEQRDRTAKINATHQFAETCEKSSLLRQDIRNIPIITTTTTTTKEQPPTLTPIITDNPLIPTSNIKEDIKRQPTPTPFSQIKNAPDSTIRQNTTDLNLSTDVPELNYNDHWTNIKIDFQRMPGKGLGFSIAGGKDTPCISDSWAVVVTRITEGGLADSDHRLKLHDIILRVNNIDFTNIEHQAAVDTLKAAESPVILIIRRLAPPIMEEIVLEKSPNVHLGFSIAGGISHEHVKGDYGIFITNIIPGGVADKNGKLKVGDRLMSVLSMKNTYELEFVEHKHAVESIRRACDDGPKITLIVGHPTVYSLNTQLQSANTSIQNQLISRNETNGPRLTTNDEQEEFSLERQVLLRRGPNGFGFNIISSEGGQGTFISFIPSGGVADKSGQLRKGDRILSVNNIDLQAASHEELGRVLNNCGDTANLHVIHRYNDFLQCQARNDERRNRLTTEPSGSTVNVKTSTRKQFFVRAEFDYDPTRDPSLPGSPGIAFRAGDILHVINAADDSWWQAKRVIDGREEETGIIPSKSRVEKKERARQKRVNFNQDNNRGNISDHEKKKKKKLGLFNKTADKKDVQSGDDTGNESENLEPVPSYQLVVQHKIDYARPIIIFGSFKEILNDQLLSDQPDKFVSCIPHTTRTKRDKEVDGREYHFVSNRKQMEDDIQNYLFIEAGEYGGNLYGTSVNAVREVAYASKHCVLDVSGRAIKRLMRAGLYPIAIYVKPRDIKWILDNMGQEVNENQAKLIYDKSNEIEEHFGDLFTVTIDEENLSDVYDRIREIIDHENRIKYAWMPSDEKI
ncbi:unnamed protein product [Rotaria sordida]|uniref:Uncharacterized protein n=1 Tax=Rotaria sordida TaxID=392033 RepID=A0A815HNU0_9BILA|nr:unnamed protein product [Rotaria sordida]